MARGRLHLGDQGPKVADELGGEVGLLEGPGDEIVAEVGEGQVVEAVLLHEEVEKIGRDHGQRGDVDLDLRAKLRGQPTTRGYPSSGPSRGLFRPGRPGRWP